MLWRRQSSLVKPLEPSSCAALADGPKTLMPAVVQGDRPGPATSGASGPTTTKSIFSPGRAPPGPRCPRRRRRCIRPPGRCRHCRGRSRAWCTAGRPQSPSTAHVRGRRRRPPGFAWRGFDHSLRCSAQAARLRRTMDNLDPRVRPQQRPGIHRLRALLCAEARAREARSRACACAARSASPRSRAPATAISA